MVVVAVVAVMVVIMIIRVKTDGFKCLKQLTDRYIRPAKKELAFDF